jgi:hypothetical protein
VRENGTREVCQKCEFMCEGMELPAVEIPKRQNKYLKEKEVVEIKRMKKKGLL